LTRYRSGGDVRFELNGDEHALEEGDLEVQQEAAAGLIVKGEGAFTVALDPEIDPELRAEGLARELINRVQRLRKDAGLEITDRIDLAIAGSDPLQAAAHEHKEFIARETLALAVTVGSADGDFSHDREVDIDGTPARISLRLSAA
jgi:isoleucyl-tRNA synthetase